MNSPTWVLSFTVSVGRLWRLPVLARRGAHEVGLVAREAFDLPGLQLAYDAAFEAVLLTTARWA